jgi:DNA-binding MarR family transcriptional regulator
VTFNLDESIGYRIERTQQILKRELRNRFHNQGYDISPMQWVVLYRLWQRDGMTPVEIAESTFRDRPNITRMIEVLERNGLVTRRPNPNDRRSFFVMLTPAGRALEDRLPAITRRHIAQATCGIDPADLTVAKHVLDAMCANFEDCPKHSGSQKDVHGHTAGR